MNKFTTRFILLFFLHPLLGDKYKASVPINTATSPPFSLHPLLGDNCEGIVPCIQQTLNCRTDDRTVRRAFGEDRSCILPFSFLETWYTTCSVRDDNFPWCSLRVNERGEHLQFSEDGRPTWGYCNLSCPLPDSLILQPNVKECAQREVCLAEGKCNSYRKDDDDDDRNKCHQTYRVNGYCCSTETRNDSSWGQWQEWKPSKVFGNGTQRFCKQRNCSRPGACEGQRQICRIKAGKSEIIASTDYNGESWESWQAIAGVVIGCIVAVIILVFGISTICYRIVSKKTIHVPDYQYVCREQQKMNSNISQCSSRKTSEIRTGGSSRDEMYENTRTAQVNQLEADYENCGASQSQSESDHYYQSSECTDKSTSDYQCEGSEDEHLYESISRELGMDLDSSQYEPVVVNDCPK